MENLEYCEGYRIVIYKPLLEFQGSNVTQPSQIVLFQHGDGFLNGLVPDFIRLLDDQFSASSALFPRLRAALQLVARRSADL